MHSPQVILEVVAATELFPVAAALHVKALPVTSLEQYVLDIDHGMTGGQPTWDLVDALFVALAVIGCCKALCPRARLETAVMHLHVFQLVLAGGRVREGGNGRN